MASYFQAVHPEPFRILGLTLLPLSLGRYRLLKRFNCAFVAEGPAISRPGDLILGIFICSMRCEEFLELVSNGRYAEEIERWGDKVFNTGPQRRFLPKKFQKPKPFNYLEKVQLFKRYLKEGGDPPKYWEEESSGQTSGAHWSQSMEVVLRGELGWSREEIEETPLSKAITDYYKWLENKGVIRLMNDYELGIIAEMEKVAAQANGGVSGT